MISRKAAAPEGRAGVKGEIMGRLTGHVRFGEFVQKDKNKRQK